MAQGQCLKIVFGIDHNELVSEIENIIFAGKHIDVVIRLGEFALRPDGLDKDRAFLATWLIIYTPQRKGDIVKA